jgi:protein TonB
MSYLNQTPDPRRRAGALAGTLAVNAVLGLIVVTGLTMTGFGPRPRAYLPIVDFTTPPPPQPTPGPSQEPVAATAPTPQAPVPPHPLPPTPGPARAPFDPTTVIPSVVPRVDPGPTVAPTPRPAPSFTPTAPRPSTDSATWITANDYPRRSLLEGREGLARYRLVIGTNGQVSSCEITVSTGDRQLDQATCRYITRRARFEAATNETGAKVLGTYTGSVRWQIPD